MPDESKRTKRKFFNNKEDEMNEEWALEKIEWEYLDLIQNGDAIRINEKIVWVLNCHHSDLKGAATGRIWGRNLLIDCGEGVRKLLQVAEGLEPCFVEFN